MKRKKGFTHGTRTKYLFDKCRCEPCRAANSAYKNSYTRKYRKEGRDKAWERQTKKRENLLKSISLGKGFYEKIKG